MKKISTTAAQKMEKVESQRLTVGLDLGDRSSRKRLTCCCGLQKRDCSLRPTTDA
jgi:hypothetical protein